MVGCSALPNYLLFTRCTNIEQQSFKEKLQSFSAKVINPGDGDQRFRLTVRRDHALTDSLELIELARENELFAPLSVVFLGESAVDVGGPCRELASLIVVQSSSDDAYLVKGENILLYVSNSIVTSSNSFIRRFSQYSHFIPRTWETLPLELWLPSVSSSASSPQPLLAITHSQFLSKLKTFLFTQSHPP